LIKCYSALETGGSVNIIKKYFSDDLIISYDNMVNVLIGCTPRLFGVDNDSISKYVSRTKELHKSIDSSRVKLLI
ncbi:MAG: hypothetical protein KMY55_09705, partial [Dethiosulfatibacter sp.]|nr:hypothetical protein [Dethiosulfatibacter sp.]